MTVGTGKFISKKVSAVRWQPLLDTSQTCSSTLAAGSWDDETNSVSVWSGASPGGEASLLASADVPGDVTGLEWLSPDTLTLSCSSGQVQVYRLAGLGGLHLLQDWAGLHRPGAGGATALARHGDSLASGGQDGRINLLVATNRTPLKVYDKADSCSITALTFSKTSELVSSNMRGQIKTWDLRSNSQTPVTNSSQGGAVRCLATHPTQSHVMMAGGEDGVLAVWDLRSPTHPATLLSADKAAISEVVFHPSQPDHVFTCSQAGDLCHWNSSGLTRDSLSHVSAWLSYEAVKHRVETHSLVSRQPLPLNSLDVLGDSVVFGGDNEAFYVLHSVIA